MIEFEDFIEHEVINKEWIWLDDVFIICNR